MSYISAQYHFNKDLHTPVIRQTLTHAFSLSPSHSLTHAHIHTKPCNNLCIFLLLYATPHRNAQLAVYSPI